MGGGSSYWSWRWPARNRYTLEHVQNDGADARNEKKRAHSSVFSSLNRPAASRILENSMQNACTSMNRS